MNFTATNRQGRNGARIWLKALGALMLAGFLAIGFFTAASAQGETTLTLKLIGVTPSDADNWLSLALTGRFDVSVDGEIIGRVTANPTTEQAAAGEMDTLTLPADTGEVVLTPVAEDFTEDFVCEDPVTIVLNKGEANVKTVFAYAKRGLFAVSNVSAKDGKPLPNAEFVVLDSQSNMQWSFTTDESGTYTARQSLPNGDYQLVQMLAPEGTLLLSDPIPFTVNTYFGNVESMTSVTVSNQPAPVENSVTGNLSLNTPDFTRDGELWHAALTVSGLCTGENTVPLNDYTVTLSPAAMFDGDGVALGDNACLMVDTVTMNAAGTVQPLDATGLPMGETVPCEAGQTVELMGASGVAVTYLDANGDAEVAEGFNAGALVIGLQYRTTDANPNERTAVSASIRVNVGYTYQYPAPDGSSDVTAESVIDPQTVKLALPDGKTMLNASAHTSALSDGTPVIGLAVKIDPTVENALPMAVELPMGARAADSLPEGLTLLRTSDADYIVFDSEAAADGKVQIPLKAGNGEAVTIWTLDPQTLSKSADNPNGETISADAHQANALLDVYFQQQNGSYAVLTVKLDGGVDTGKTAASQTVLLSGAVTEQTSQASADAKGLGVLLTVTDSSVIYGAITDENGNFTISGDANATDGKLTAALPENTFGIQSQERGFETLANINLPQNGVTVTFARTSGLSGMIATDTGDPMAGVALTLVQDGQTVQQAQTGRDGGYAFSDLPAGVYDLNIVLPEGVDAALQTQVGVAQEESGFSVRGVTLAYGETQSLNLTATLLCKAKGTVTEDGAPAEGVTVTMTGESGATLSVQTDAEGAYAFSELAAGDYHLTIQLSEKRAVVSVNGQDVQAAGGYTAAYTLADGETREDAFVLQKTASITGVIASLSEGDNVAIASVSTQRSETAAGDGSFAFAGLIAGDYTIYAPLPAGETLVTGSQWRVSEQGDMIWVTVNVAPGDSYVLPTVEFVDVTSIGGVAFMDDNGSLTREDGEQLMSGVPVALQRKDGGAWSDVANLTTDEYGHYLFDNLSEGVYRVVSQAGDDLHVAAVGSAANALGDATRGIMTSGEMTLSNGDTLTADIALDKSAKINVAAFFDSNENGTRGEYERSATGVTVAAVSAADPEGDAVASAVTNGDGAATITGLAPGSYVLRVTLPDGYLFTAKGEGWSIGDSCVGGTEDATAVSDTITLTSGQTAEAGVAAIPVGSFSGKVWNDQNNNGVMDEDEAGVANVVLKLTGTKSNVAYQITTDDTGDYRFSLLRNDTYNFTAELPEGYLFARYTKTGGDSRSVFTTDGTSSTRQFVVSGAENVTDKNVGVILKAGLTGIAFLDTNYNGVFDEGEPPYAGVTLEVIKNSNSKSMGKVVTGEDGTYAFDSLRGGDYRLRAILPNDGSIFTFVPEQGTGLVNQFVAREGRRENSIQSIAIENGETAETCVGVALGGTITGTVFYDKKYDGVMNSGDSNASGIKVQLLDELGEVAATTTTNAKGGYTLEGIMPGNYIVRFQRKNGYAFTRYRPDEQGGNDVASLAKDGYGETASIAVAMGQTVEQVNAGMLPSSTLIGIFFDDLNDNGLQDEGETGYTDGSVRLLSEDGEIDLTEPVAEDGTYFFDGVMPGEYTVTYLLPENATMANVAEGGNTLEAQGRQNVLTGFTVESGKAYEAPLVGAVTLGTFEGYAYHDQNGNNVRDDGEETLAGVTVVCTPKSGTLTATQAVTGDDGVFSLTNLRPGEYSLSITLPNGYIFSGNLTQSGLTLDAASSDSLSCPWTALTNRAQNAVGAVHPATVSASVWLDENRDGANTENERLLSGLAYELYDEQMGRTVKTARSGDDGYVTFENVRPATYTVRFVLPEQAQPADAEGDFVRKGDVMMHTGVVVTEGSTIEGITGGLVSYTSIGGTVILEENGARTVQPGVEVSLYQGDDTKPVNTVATDDTGTYRFDGLWPDTYHITVTEPDGTIFVQPDDPNYDTGASVVTRSADGVGESDAFELEMAQHLLSMNVILIKPARVGDQVWLDSNRNGLVDAEEPTINGVTVQLVQNGETIYTTVSNEWGYYEFANVYPGTYTLVAQAYPALTITKSIPALRMISSCLTSGDGTSAQSDPFSVESGTKNFDFDLGYILPDGAAMPEEIVTGNVQHWPSAQETEE